MWFELTWFNVGKQIWFELTYDIRDNLGKKTVLH